MKYEFVLTEQMENDRKNCGEDSRCLECSCHMGEDDCVFNHLAEQEYDDEIKVGDEIVCMDAHKDILV